MNVSRKTSARDGQLMKCVFLDADSILLVDFLEGEKPVISAYYKSVFRKLAKI